MSSDSEQSEWSDSEREGTERVNTERADTEVTQKNQSEEDEDDGKVYYTAKDGSKKILPDGMTPPRLREPIFIKSKKKKEDEDNTEKKEHKIDFNKPKDQMVLIEDKPVEEFEEAEEMLAKYGDPMDCEFFGGKKKKPNVALKDWELEYADIFGKVKEKIPILNFSNIKEIDNFAKASTIINTFRKFNKDTIVTYSGGFSNSGGFESTSFKGRHIIHLLNQLKVDFLSLGTEDLENPEIIERISDFEGAIVNSNLKSRKGDKISRVSSYVIRKIQNFKVCFLGANFSESENFKILDPKEELEELLDDTLKGKYDFAVLLSGQNFGFKGINLVLSYSSGINSLNFIGKIYVLASDINLESLSVSLIDKKTKKVETAIISTQGIPEDKNFSMHTKYWKDLGSGELKAKFGVDINKSLGNKKIISQKILFQAIKKYNQGNKIDAGYIILDREMKLKLAEESDVYDFFKLYPRDVKFVKIGINDLEILGRILEDQRTVYTKLEENNIILCSEDLAREVISEYLDEISALVLVDLKVILCQYFL